MLSINRFQFCKRHLKRDFFLFFFPSHIFQGCVKTYLDTFFQPKPLVATVPKCIQYVSFPYLGFKTKSLQKDLIKLINKHFPFLDVRLAFSNPYKISSFFSFKDSMVSLMRSNVVYLYNCPKCTLGRYIGCTTRLLRVRICDHMGVSHRTMDPISSQESSIRKHASRCKANISFSDFKILFTSNSKQSLLIGESILIKQLSPQLNADQSSIPLYIT